MDDDCERAMYRAYHVLLAFIDFGIKSIGEYTWFNQQYHYNCLWIDPEDVRKQLQNNKKAVNECINCTRTIEIHYQNEENSKPAVLARVNFQYNSGVSADVLTLT